MIHFACPGCGTGLKAKDNKTGRRTRCPKCRSPIEVPVPRSETVPAAAVDQSLSVSDSNDLEPAWEQRARKQRTGLLLLSLFVSGLVCGTLVFVVIFSKMKEARMSRSEPLPPRLPATPGPGTGAQEESKETAGRVDPVATIPLPKPEPEPRQTPGGEKREPKEEEYEAQPKKILPPSAADAPAPSKPPAKTVDEASFKESEALVAPFVHDLKQQKTTERRLKALEAIAQLGPKGKAASRALCESLLDPSVRIRLAAAETLDKVNPNLHRLVIPIIVDKELETRLECVRKLRELGPEGNPAVPVVIYFKQQYQGGALAIEALAAIAPDDKAVTAKVAAWLTSDSDPHVRLAAVKALPHMAGAKDQVRAFMQVLRADPIDGVRAAAASALGDLGPDAKEADKLLRLAKTDASAQVREAAERALQKIQR